jgi:hypothetical protein
MRVLDQIINGCQGHQMQVGFDKTTSALHETN